MGRLIPHNKANISRESDSNNISVIFAFIILVIISVFVYSIHRCSQLIEIKQAETVRMLNDCECAKHKERNVVAVNGILSGRIETKTVIICKNGRVFTNLTDSQYFNIKICED